MPTLSWLLVPADCRLYGTQNPHLLSGNNWPQPAAERGRDSLSLDTLPLLGFTNLVGREDPRGLPTFLLECLYHLIVKSFLMSFLNHYPLVF